MISHADNSTYSQHPWKRRTRVALDLASLSLRAGACWRHRKCYGGRTSDRHWRRSRTAASAGRIEEGRGKAVRVGREITWRLGRGVGGTDGCQVELHRRQLADCEHGWSCSASGGSDGTRFAKSLRRRFRSYSCDGNPVEAEADVARAAVVVVERGSARNWIFRSGSRAEVVGLVFVLLLHARVGRELRDADERLDRRPVVAHDVRVGFLQRITQKMHMTLHTCIKLQNALFLRA